MKKLSRKISIEISEKILLSFAESHCFDNFTVFTLANTKLSSTLRADRNQIEGSQRKFLITNEPTTSLQDIKPNDSFNLEIILNIFNYLKNLQHPEKKGYYIFLYMVMVTNPNQEYRSYSIEILQKILNSKQNHSFNPVYFANDDAFQVLLKTLEKPLVSPEYNISWFIMRTVFELTESRTFISLSIYSQIFCFIASNLIHADILDSIFLQIDKLPIEIIQQSYQLIYMLLQCQDVNCQIHDLLLISYLCDKNIPVNPSFVELCFRKYYGSDNEDIIRCLLRLFPHLDTNSELTYIFFQALLGLIDFNTNNNSTLRYEALLALFQSVKTWQEPQKSELVSLLLKNIDRYSFRDLSLALYLILKFSDVPPKEIGFFHKLTEVVCSQNNLLAEMLDGLYRFLLKNEAGDNTEVINTLKEIEPLIATMQEDENENVAEHAKVLYPVILNVLNYM